MSRKGENGDSRFVGNVIIGDPEEARARYYEAIRGMRCKYSTDDEKNENSVRLSIQEYNSSQNFFFQGYTYRVVLELVNGRFRSTDIFQSSSQVKKWLSHSVDTSVTYITIYSKEY
jgi:hypothetical protein